MAVSEQSGNGEPLQRPRGTETSVEVEAPIDAVFAAISDFAGAPERISKIKKVEVLTDGPVGVGTRFRETRIMFGKEAAETMEVTSFDPPHGYDLIAGSHGCQYFSGLRCEALGDGRTQLTMYFSAVPQTFLAKVMAFLTKPMTRMVAKLCAQDLNEIKAWLESGGAAAGSASSDAS